MSHNIIIIISIQLNAYNSWIFFNTILYLFNVINMFSNIIFLIIIFFWLFSFKSI